MFGCLWGLGDIQVFDFLFKVVVYIVWYIMEKVNGDEVVGYYQCLDLDMGEVFEFCFEYCFMFKNFGFGGCYVDNYFCDMFQFGICVLDGCEVNLFCFYEKWLCGYVEFEFIEFQWYLCVKCNYLDQFLEWWVV